MMHWMLGKLAGAGLLSLSTSVGPEIVTELLLPLIDSKTVVTSEACCWFKSIFVTADIVHIWSEVSVVGSPRESTDCGIHYIINLIPISLRLVLFLIIIFFIIIA